MPKQALNLILGDLAPTDAGPPPPAPAWLPARLFAESDDVAGAPIIAECKHSYDLEYQRRRSAQVPNIILKRRSPPAS